ncbi:Uncharacterised protein [Serratia fonticola]|nr:Uncharacterised protein [Serratia fonticola]
MEQTWGRLGGTIQKHNILLVQNGHLLVQSWFKIKNKFF